MPDVAVEQTPAGSSPATEPHSTMEVPQGAEYAAWRQTGKLPERTPAAAPKPKTEKPATSNEPSETVPASEAGSQERKPRGNADTRLTELLNDLRDAGLSPAQLKTFKLDYQRKQTTEGQQAQPNPEKTVNPAEPDRPTRPKLDDFKTVDEYEAAVDKYHEDLSDWKSDQKLKAYDQTQRAKADKQALDQKMAAATTRYGETAGATITSAAKAIHGDAQIPQAVKTILDQSPVIVDVLYTIGSNAEELQQLVEMSRTDPGAAIRKIVLVEKLVEEELAKGGSASAGKPTGATAEPERGEDGKFKPAVEKPAPETKVSKAPQPAKEVSGRGAAPTDEVEAAAKNNDFTAFRNAQNRRDVERRKGR